MVINFEFPDDNPETGDKNDHNEMVVSEDILETSHNNNVTLTDTQPGVTVLPKNHGGCLSALVCSVWKCKAVNIVFPDMDSNKKNVEALNFYRQVQEVWYYLYILIWYNNV